MKSRRRIAIVSTCLIGMLWPIVCAAQSNDPNKEGLALIKEAAAEFCGKGSAISAYRDRRLSRWRYNAASAGFDGRQKLLPRPVARTPKYQVARTPRI